LRFNRIDRRHVYQGIFFKVPKNLKDVENFTPLPSNYPPARREAKFILVDLSEQFLGGYEFGRLVFSAPVTTGEKSFQTPAGKFKITAADRNHTSSLYVMEGTTTPYPMNYALLFHIDKEGVSFWIHGRDVPGYPASHGCIGLYDEEMQKEYYGFPPDPELADVKQLYEWVLGARPDKGELIRFADGPKVLITGQAP
ncbi:MAG: L,D-transpeptidase, partial [Nitrospiria bacterium]